MTEQGSQVNAARIITALNVEITLVSLALCHNCCIPAAQGLRGIGGDAGLKLYFMENRFLTPQKWKKYEKEAVKVAQDWIERAQYENEDWHYHIHLFAAKVYNRGDGLVSILQRANPTVWNDKRI